MTVTTLGVFSVVERPTPAYVACDFVIGNPFLLYLPDPEKVDKVEWCDGRQLAERVRNGIPENVQNYLDSVLER